MKSDYKYQRTLGEMLREARLAKNITIEELSVTTKIHKRLIQTLESDDLYNFPNRVYVIGFLKSMSEELRFNLNEAMHLYEVQCWKNKQRALPEVKRELPIPDKTVTFHHPLFFKQIVKIKVKWLLAGAFLFVFLIVISPLLVEGKIPEAKKAVTKVSVEKSRSRPKNNERKIAYIQGSQKVLIKAHNGSSWISFKVDKNPVRQLTLKKGSSIILSGEKIRLTVGNFKALEVKNNNLAVSNFKRNKNKTVSISFPQKEVEKPTEAELILSHDAIQVQNPRL